MIKNDKGRCKKAGIIADSHGYPEIIDRGISFLKKKGCRCIYHLGDICDSFMPETAEQCIFILKKNNVVAIKGNNDHKIMKLQRDKNIGIMSHKNFSYLQKLPIVIMYQNIILTHSVPFINELGKMCMIKNMDKKQADIFFRVFPKNILFRGHGHNPEIIWQQEKNILFKPLFPEQRIKLKDKLPCIITCGAMIKGFCMILNFERKEIGCYAFNIPDKLLT